MVDTLSLVELANNIIGSTNPNLSQILKSHAQNYLNGTISAESFLIYLMSEYGRNAVTAMTFEQLYPKQTSQLIKIGQDLTALGQIDVRQDASIKDLYAKTSMLGDQTQSLGDSLTELSESVNTRFEEQWNRPTGGGGDWFSSFMGGLGVSSPIIIIGIIIFIFLSRR